MLLRALEDKRPRHHRVGNPWLLMMLELLPEWLIDALFRWWHAGRAGDRSLEWIRMHACGSAAVAAAAARGQDSGAFAAATM